MEVNYKNPICEDLSLRITQLFEFGVSSIWMQATGSHRYHITNVLGISRDVFNEVILFSGLYTKDGMLKRTYETDWPSKLKLSRRRRKRS